MISRKRNPPASDLFYLVGQGVAAELGKQGQSLIGDIFSTVRQGLGYSSPQALGPDPARILGVSPEATQEEVRRAYLEKAKLHHPDKGGDPGAWYAVQWAYERLKAPQNI